jgi:hypothetical protein
MIGTDGVVIIISFEVSSLIKCSFTVIIIELLEGVVLLNKYSYKVGSRECRWYLVFIEINLFVNNSNGIELV